MAEVIFAYKKMQVMMERGRSENDKAFAQYKFKCDYLRVVELWVLFALGLVTWCIIQLFLGLFPSLMLHTAVDQQQLICFTVF